MCESRYVFSENVFGESEIKLWSINLYFMLRVKLIEPLRCAILCLLFLKCIIPCFALKHWTTKVVSVWLPTILIILICFYPYSEDVCKRGFTVIIDMRGSKWDLIKPLLKTLQEAFPAEIHVALIIKPDNFWQKQKTNFGSSKFIFEVRATWWSTVSDKKFSSG